MNIKFKYSVDFGNGVQHHDREIIVKVDGEPGANGTPTYEQLWQAEDRFRAAWRNEHGPKHRLLKYEAIPADGSKARFADYRAYLPV